MPLGGVTIPTRTETSAWPYRLAFASVVACSIAAIAVTYFVSSDVYLRLLTRWGIVPWPQPFLDAHGILAAIECHRSGLNVAVDNPCDMLRRTWNYPPIWLDLFPAFLTTTQTPVVGLALDLLFLASVFVLLRPNSRAEVVACVLAVLSTDVVLALERANADLLIFVLTVCFVAVSGAGTAWRILAYAIAFLAGTLKYYPFVLLTMVLREPRRLRLALLGAGVLALAAYLWRYADALWTGVATLSAVKPYMYFSDQFGARNLPYGFAHLWTSDEAMTSIMGCVGLFAATGAAAASAKFYKDLARRHGLPTDWNTLEGRALLAGSLLVVGCFFAGLNIGYRGIHLLLVLSGLLALRRSAHGVPLRAGLGVTIGALLLVMWQQAIAFQFTPVTTGRPAIPTFEFWILRELTWWWLISVLMALIWAWIDDASDARLTEAKYQLRIGPGAGGPPGLTRLDERSRLRS